MKEILVKTYDKFVGLWQDEESVGTRATRGSALAFISRSFSKVILLFRTVIVARILFPHDVGLFGLASLVLSMTELPFQTGFNSAIIQDNNDVEKHLNSAWTVNIIRGLFLGLLVFLVAPFAGRFFNNQLIVPIARALSSMFVIDSFSNIGIILLDKEMKFGQKFFYSFFGPIINVAGIIISAIIFRNVWALVVGAIIGKIGYLILSYVLHPYRPKLNFDISGARYLYRYGKWIGIAGIASFLIAQGDSVTVGKLIDTSNLAFYQMAFSLGIFPVVETVSVIGDVLFPLFANIKNDVQRLKLVFLRVSKFIYAFMVPAAFGLFVLAREIVNFIYGSRWLPIVPVLYVVIGYGFLRSFEYLAVPLLQGIGKPKTTFLNSFLQAAVLFTLIVPLTHRFGIVGTAWAALGGLASGQIYLLHTIRKEINFGLKTFIRGMYLPLTAGLIMALSIWEAKKFLVVATLPLLLVFVAGGAVVYFCALLVLDKIFQDDFYDSFLWIKNNI